MKSNQHATKLIAAQPSLHLRTCFVTTLPYHLSQQQHQGYVCCKATLLWPSTLLRTGLHKHTSPCTCHNVPTATSTYLQQPWLIQGGTCQPHRVRIYIPLQRSTLRHNLQIMPPGPTYPYPLPSAKEAETSCIHCSPACCAPSAILVAVATHAHSSCTAAPAVCCSAGST